MPTVDASRDHRRQQDVEGHAGDRSISHSSSARSSKRGVIVERLADESPVAAVAPQPGRGQTLEAPANDRIAPFGGERSCLPNVARVEQHPSAVERRQMPWGRERRGQLLERFAAPGSAFPEPGLERLPHHRFDLAEGSRPPRLSSSRVYSTTRLPCPISPRSRSRRSAMSAWVPAYFSSGLPRCGESEAVSSGSVDQPEVEDHDDVSPDSKPSEKIPLQSTPVAVL